MGITYSYVVTAVGLGDEFQNQESIFKKVIRIADKENLLY